MPTDMVAGDERREIAAGLRMAAEQGQPYTEPTLACFVRADRLSSIWDRLANLIEPEKITGETSDGYHTFDELYDHRAKLFSVIVRDHREIAWKSMLHHDGTMYDGMFIVGVETPDGQATYHYDVDPYWALFDCAELERAPEWDGHTPSQAIDRIAALSLACDREELLYLTKKLDARATDLLKLNYLDHSRQRKSARREHARDLMAVCSLIRELCGVVE